MPRSKLFWVAVLYFSSGFPFGLINNLLPAYLRSEGASLPFIGRLVSAVGLAWTFKFLWAWLVDRFATRKRWVIACQAGLIAATAALVTADPIAAPAYLAALLVALALLSATQDIAIDAYTIELLDEREMGPANGMRVTAYRVALIAAGGLVLSLAGLTSWTTAFVAGAVIMLLLTLITLRVPSRPRAAIQQPVWQSFSEPLNKLFAQPGMWAGLLFIITFKFGDFAMLPMVNPFWVDRGFSPEQIGVMTGTVGMLATIAGALSGGILTARLGTFRALWMLGLVQALSNLGYYAASLMEPSLIVGYGAVIVEQFTAGLGTAAFLTFMMSICDKRYAAMQYALLSAAYGLGRTLVGYFSGDLAQNLGYSSYFLVTFALAFPAFALLPFVRKLKRNQVSAEESAAIA
ncbi:MAG: MFS transporter [Gemmatimonadaceae bacterium]|nr:MFS transporter [Gemmatimonadaceae bacterium]MDQ3518268.1 MFS transporter [Gemmatimonadota bacterium]